MREMTKFKWHAVITKSTPEAKFTLNGMDEDTRQTIERLDTYLTKVVSF